MTKKKSVETQLESLSEQLEEKLKKQQKDYNSYFKGKKLQHPVCACRQ